MKSLLPLFFLFCGFSSSSQSRWSDWITLYEEGYDRAQISFKINGCQNSSTPNVINSYWRYRSTFTKPRAWLRGKFEFAVCTGGTRVETFNFGLEKPFEGKEEGDWGKWFMGATRVIRVFDVQTGGLNNVTQNNPTSQNYNQNNDRVNQNSYGANKTESDVEQADLIREIESQIQQRQQSYDQLANSITQIGDYFLDKIKREHVQEMKQSASDHFDRLKEDVKNGRGTLVTCSLCRGGGIERCNVCDGAGHKDCYMCAGSGETNCMVCGGSGKYGTIRCTACAGAGKSRCTTCSGKGKSSCIECIGVGYDNCNSCMGTGKELRY